ncbi:hypothetical protein BDZ97DRAFT_2065881 [Flammula alnicola]|nr:hypothetical protein BDZ97DRAFT_2065881 [Flammula alnicola]
MHWACGGEFHSPVDRRWAVQICASLAGHTNVLVPLGGVGCRPTSSGFDILDAVSENVYEPYACQFSSFVICLCLETCPMVDDNTRGKIFEGEEETRTCTTYREIRLHGENLGLNGGQQEPRSMNRQSLLSGQRRADRGTYEWAMNSTLQASMGEIKARRGEEEKREEGDEDIRFSKHLYDQGSYWVLDQQFAKRAFDRRLSDHPSLHLTFVHSSTTFVEQWLLIN